LFKFLLYPVFRFFSFFILFDPYFYKYIYPDLKTFSTDNLKNHWFLHGFHEGRIGSLKQLFASVIMQKTLNFSASRYKKNNPDLSQDWNYLKCLIHYLQYGKKEGRILKELSLPDYLSKSILENALGRPLFKGETQVLNQVSTLNLIVDRIKTIFVNSEKYKEIFQENRKCFFCLINSFSLQILSRDLNPYEIYRFRLEISKSSDTGLENFFTYLFSHAFKEPLILEKFLSTEQVTDLMPNPLNEINIIGGHENKIQLILESNLKSPIFNTLKIRESQKISLICSAYNGIEFVRSFLTNTVNLEGFKDLSELIIIDANSTENIAEIIRPFTEKYSNIHYSRVDFKLNIYETWNQLIKKCTFELISNSNLDDIKHPNFLVEFTGNANRLSNFDVFYSDYVYLNNYDPKIFNSKRKQISTYLPQTNFFSLIHFNVPHCSPVWRKSLHQRIGLFNEDNESSSDWDFWIRCAKQNVKFLKIPGPLCAYYYNPDGLSTNSTSKGVKEQWKIRKDYEKFLFIELCDLEQDYVNDISSPSLNYQLLASYLDSSSNL